VHFTPDAPQVFRLSSGFPVYYQRQGTTPLAVLALVIPRGSATDPRGKAGLTALSVDLLDEGAGELDALELSGELQRLATDYVAEVGVDGSLLVMNLLAQNFEPSARILADIVRRPRLDQDDFSRRKALRIAAAVAGESDPIHARDVTVRAALFGAGYGGHPADGTRPTIESIQHRDVVTHLSGLLAADNGAFVVVGGVDREAVRGALERAFGDWRGDARMRDAPVLDAPSASEIAMVDFPGAPQSVIALVQRAGGVHAAEYFPALVFNRAFGEAFGSRLNLNLRESKGYSYGARSSFVRWGKAGYFGSFASVETAVTALSVEVMRDELRQLCTERPIDEEERDQAVQGLLLGLPGRFERSADTAAQLIDLPLFSRPPDWYTLWPERVREVDAPEVNAVAQSYCEHPFTVVVAGDRGAIQPSLARLGLRVIAYDARGRRLGRPRAAK
jgi:zinc protease